MKCPNCGWQGAVDLLDEGTHEVKCPSCQHIWKAPGPYPYREKIERPETSLEDAVRWWVGNDGDHTSMLYYLSEWEAYADELANQLSLIGTCPGCGERIWATRDKDDLYTTWKCQACGWGDVQS